MSDRRTTVEDEPMEATWMTTYSDLVTLLLCFFVLLFAMSTIDNNKFKKFLESFQAGGISVIGEGGSSSAPIDIGEGINEEIPPAEEKIEETEDEKFERINKEINEFVKENNLDSTVSVYSQQEGVLIRFNDSVLFDKGSASLKGDAVRILGDMSALLKNYVRMVKVEGHTDDDPISTGIYPSNWELSTARAVNVVKFFIEGVSQERRISPDLLQAAGYGEYHPLVENINEASKAKNRRIEIVILKNTVKN